MYLRLSNAIVSLEKVEAIIEKRFDFNGKGYRMLEVSNKIEEANALLLHVTNDSSVLAPTPKTDTILAGNLDNKKVRALMIQAVREGYIDLNLHFQDFQLDPDQYLFDEGYSAPPYLIKGFAALSGFNMPCFTQSGVGESPFMNDPEENGEDSFEKDETAVSDDGYDDEYGDFEDYVFEDDEED